MKNLLDLLFDDILDIINEKVKESNINDKRIERKKKRKIQKQQNRINKHYKICQQISKNAYEKYNNISNIAELKSLGELKIIDIGQNPIKNIDDLDELKKIEYIYLPQYCTSKNLDRKLKNNINDNMDGRIITNYKVYFNKYYISSMGFSINRLAFKL